MVLKFVKIREFYTFCKIRSNLLKFGGLLTTVGLQRLTNENEFGVVTFNFGVMTILKLALKTEIFLSFIGIFVY